MGRGEHAPVTVQDENGIYRSLARERRHQRRKQLGVGLAGLAALGGAAFFVVQSQLVDLSRNTAIREPRVIAPVSPSPTVSSTPATPASPVAAASPGRVSRSGARQEASPTPPPPSPSVSAPSESTGLAVASTLNEHSESTGSGRIRVTSAEYDLTGRPELAIAGDTGWLVGGARCTKTVRAATGEQARVVPSMLICWRTSASRSVVTVAVADQGRPSSGDSVAAIRREWNRLS
ncbi:hypothetical protein M1L60_21530 [Actinoplanes sp. TRM 88003]|uniref:Uncharacterized protein n=1 Tax=Paractinoplanes aksuensis TaxID=2939490 RepID=A0ABT1DRN9_9ACTN|nr:hypothetical protein [Actinoplanes aksuensis]MCO8273178.1 hypothetical protein [Actinoplanes aksuensis]